MQYLAYDGKVFDDAKACLEYEGGKPGETRKPKMLEALHELDSLRDKVLTAIETYEEALEQYEKEYFSVDKDLQDEFEDGMEEEEDEYLTEEDFKDLMIRFLEYLSH